MPECVHRPSESRETEDAEGVESEGCKGVMSEGACIDEADGDPDQGVEPTETQNELDPLVTMSIESEGPDGSEIPCVRLGCTSWCAGNANGPGNRMDRSRGQADESEGLADGSKGQADVLRGSTDASSASNRAETDGMSNGEGAGTYLGAGDAKCVVDARNGVGNHMDASSRHSDMPSVKTDAISTANVTEIISTPRKRKKPPDSLVEAAKCAPDESNGLRDHTDSSSGVTHQTGLVQ